jgi:uncharacterized protein (TIGR03086 family)
VATIILLDRALDDLAEVVALVPRDELPDATTVPGWDVAALLRHLVELNWVFGSLAEGGDFEVDDNADVDLLGVDHLAAFEASRKTALAGWHDPDAFNRTFHLHDGAIDGETAFHRHLAEVTVHGWDLAHAVGAHFVIDPEVADHLLSRVGPDHSLTCEARDRHVDLVAAESTRHLLAALGRTS